MNGSRMRKSLAALLAVAVVGGLGACSGVKPASNEKYLYFKNGAGDSRVFQECVNGGTTGPWQADNDVFVISTALRNWNILASGGDSNEAIVSGTRPGNDGQPGPQVKIFLTADFYLNNECGKDNKDPNSPVVKFWNKTGSRFEISSPTGEFRKDKWIEMLQNTLVPAEIKGLQEGTKFYTADELDYNQGNSWAKLEKQMAPTIRTQLSEKVGGDYFCGPSYDSGKPVKWLEPSVGEDGKVTEKEVTGTCPPIKISIISIDHADENVAKARADVYAAQLRAQAALIAAQSQVDVANKLKEAGTPEILLRIKELETQIEIAKLQLEAAKACAANQNCTVIVGPLAGFDIKATK